MLRTIGNRSLISFRSMLVGTSKRTLSSCDNDEKVVEYECVKKMTCIKCGLIIDVRCPDELKETGQIPTSINIPLSQLKLALSEITSNEEFLDKYCVNKPAFCDEIVTTCKGGKQAKEAMEIAECLGYTNVKYYKGSWSDWAAREGLKK